MLTSIDEFTRECVAIKIGISWPGRRVIRVLERLLRAYGSPEFLRSGSGPEFFALNVDSWRRERRAAMTYFDPNSPL
jgi:putative transposase